MIYWVTTKDLMEKYLPKEGSDGIDRTNFLIFSPKVQCTIPMSNLLNVYNIFFSLGALKGVGLTEEPDSLEALEGFKNFLLKSPKTLLFLVEVIRSDLVSLENTLFVITPDEVDDGNIQTFVKAVEELFQYKICRYPKPAGGVIGDCVNRLNYYCEETDRVMLTNLPRARRIAVLEQRSKKQIKRMVADSGKYYKGMPKEEMIELIADGEVYLDEH